MIQLICVILALLLGYVSNLPIKSSLLNKGLSLVVMLILLVMGYDFGSKAANLLLESLQLAKIVMTFTLLLFVCNFMGAYGFAKLGKASHKNLIDKQESQRLRFYLMESAKYLAWVLMGIMLGAVIGKQFSYLSPFISTMLFVSLFIIGHQLKQQGVSLQAVLANRLGLMLSLTIVASSLIAGMVCTYLLNLHLHEGLMLASGYGWYTLSGVLSGQLINHHIGAASFFIDFFREIIAIVLIPLFGRAYPLPFIAYSGATALDFSLPAIKIHMGDDVVPIAITSGMILTILVPLIIPALFWLCHG